MNKQKLAQWVIDNRYPKSEKEKVSDLEMFNFIIDAFGDSCEQIDNKPVQSEPVPPFAKDSRMYAYLHRGMPEITNEQFAAELKRRWDKLNLSSDYAGSVAPIKEQLLKG